jgi:hypothetical protein
MDLQTEMNYAYEINSSISSDNTSDYKELGSHGYLLDTMMRIELERRLMAEFR